MNFVDFGAEALRRRALDGLCATMGEEHPNTLAVANHWANSTWLRMQAPPAATATCCVACYACYRRPHGSRSLRPHTAGGSCGAATERLKDR
jgi:hypothetical protein